MLRLSESLSKYAFLLLAILVVPLVFEMSAVLQLWLVDVPDHTVEICQIMLISSLCDQTTIGLGTANQAIGRIRNYSLTVNTIKVLTLPAMWGALYLGCTIGTAMWVFVLFECLCAFGRLPFLHVTAGLSIRHFAIHVFGRTLPPLAVIVLACWAVVAYIDIPFRFLLTSAVSVIVSLAAIWAFALEPGEKEEARKMIQSVARRIKKK